jgi:Fe-S-cluster containining protein
VQVFDEDLAALGPLVSARLVVGTGADRFMRMEGGHCAALDLSNGRFTCSIYEQRPLICRVYQEQGADSLCPPPVPGVAAPENLYRASALNDWPAAFRP